MGIADKEGTLEDALKLGLLEEEYERIREHLGRTPGFTEVAMYSGMWSEHCSYKNSILLLKELYSESERLLAEPGEENAGALRLNKNQAVVFKIESHNHPSALEPYQGAATGVGGIMRDVFTMGARPILSLNSLRFGHPEEPRNRYLMRQVVHGIGDYSNSLGIACGAGEVVFHPSYTKNPLVNAMTVGIADVDKMASAAAKGVGNLVMYVGAKTGRDGIHGASFASKELSSESESERSAVQVGDPFMEKIVMEATLECIRSHAVVAIQDMGAAGLLSSSAEMSSSGGVGMNLYLDRVPARETGMVPFEFLLSESQERMLMVVEPQKKEVVERVYGRYNLEAVVIGEITDTKRLKIYQNDRLYADVPVRSLTVNADGAPRYRRESKRPAWLDKREEEFSINDFAHALQSDSKEAVAILQKVMGDVNSASRSPIYEQYDTDIGISRIIGPGQNAGVYEVPDSEKASGKKQALAVTVDGNGYYVALDPYVGSMHNVAEAYRNISASGAEAIGITNCLNFSNPYKPENYYFFEHAVKGMSAAAEALSLPITGGNVSFYNESEDGPVLPTPTIGMVGLLDDASRAVPASAGPEETVYRVGFFEPAIGCSRYRNVMHGFPHFGKDKTPNLPILDIALEEKVSLTIRRAASQKMLRGCIDVSGGGILSALLRMLWSHQQATGVLLSFEFDSGLLPKVFQDDLELWGESAHTYLVAAADTTVAETFFKEAGVPFAKLGKVSQSESPALFFGNHVVDLQAVTESYRNGLARYFKPAH